MSPPASTMLPNEAPRTQITADTVYVLTVSRGLAAPRIREFHNGAPQDAHSVGTEGDWQIRGPGVEPVHAYLYFDGTQLYVQSALEGLVVRLGGVAVGVDWIPFPVDGVLELGTALLTLSQRGVHPASPTGSMVVHTSDFEAARSEPAAERGARVLPSTLARSEPAAERGARVLPSTLARSEPAAERGARVLPSTRATGDLAAARGARWDDDDEKTRFPQRPSFDRPVYDDDEKTRMPQRPFGESGAQNALRPAAGAQSSPYAVGPGAAEEPRFPPAEDADTGEQEATQMRVEYTGARPAAPVPYDDLQEKTRLKTGGFGERPLASPSAFEAPRPAAGSSRDLAGPRDAAARGATGMARAAVIPRERPSVKALAPVDDDEATRFAPAREPSAVRPAREASAVRPAPSVQIRVPKDRPSLPPPDRASQPPPDRASQPSPDRASQPSSDRGSDPARAKVRRKRDVPASLKETLDIGEETRLPGVPGLSGLPITGEMPALAAISDDADEKEKQRRRQKTARVPRTEQGEAYVPPPPPAPVLETSASSAKEKKPSALRTMFDRFAQHFEEVNNVRKGLYLIAPFSMLFVVLYLFMPEEQPQSTGPTISTAEPPPDAAPLTPPSDEPAQPISRPSAELVPVAPTEPLPPPIDAGFIPAPVGSKSPPNGKAPVGVMTAERAAADAYEAGRWEEALQIYRELASSPNVDPTRQRIFGEICRIIELKLGRGPKESLEAAPVPKSKF